MKIKLDPGAIMPTRAHTTDAGLDLYARETQTISAKDSAIFDTGVHIAIPAGYAGILISKSGLNLKYGITSTGLIDSGYTGSIVVKLINHGNYDYKVDAGDKISQIMFVPILTEELELTDRLDETERGDNGFGSSGKGIESTETNIKTDALCASCEFDYDEYCYGKNCLLCMHRTEKFPQQCKCLTIYEGDPCPYYRKRG